MPYISPNTSSPLSEAKQDEHSNYRYREESPAVEQQSELLTNNQESERDLFYGTEELLDALPKRWTHGVLYTLIGFAVLGIPWATLSKVDETGAARGRVEPKGATQKLDSLAGGSVKGVNVKEGDTVRAGQVLLELNSDILETEVQQTKSKLEGLQTRRSQLELLKNQLLLSIGVLEQQNQSQASEKLAQVNQAQQNLDAKQSTYNLQKLERQALLSQVQQQINTAINEQKAASARLSIDTKQVRRFSQLVKDGAVSATQVDELKKQEQESKRLYQRSKSDITQAKYRLTEEQSRYQATISQLESDIKQAKLRLQEAQSSAESVAQSGKLAVLRSQEQLKDLQTQIAAVRSEIAQTQSQMTAIKLQLQQRIVRSPIDGVIFELPVTKPGVVVQSGQRIAQIAPKNTDFVLKAQIPSQDSGFVKLGMPVKIKFDAYPFQEYGIVPGKVTWISPDSKINTSAEGSIGIYDLEITLDQQYVQSGNKRIPLTAGQTANAEVVIRQRRIIDFVLDPFKKLQKGGLET
ncbi:HlyD family efflux transporter periplasmic adaptor subunit [Nostoc sp. UHCC 0870]|uniref:HlyD family efflux transporter periplasmic adaptor subunit n=1 Tax=Nostoc sp. UHCC 0870 TaxID=2914041 RepID=UPI001EDE43FF|nr:HlyD family efflux transporter periplasmic adaptor subunit [Nostoc sp. UHCC 0870]UKO97458.1 HlyD family efflux transporter periplasmic adaptor subunit [Nostoc sp. UHCC 0870]